MTNYLFNTLSGIISSQTIMINTLSANYYSSKEIDQKISGVLQLDNLVQMNEEEINNYYNQVLQLSSSFDF